MIIKYYNRQQLVNKMMNMHTGKWKYPIYINDGNSQVFQGFHYFRPEDIGCNNHFFAIAYIDNKIVGIITYGFFNDFKCSPLYCGICYIDVHVNYRNQGIATTLIKSLCKELKSPNIIKVSQMTELGKKCKILDLFYKYANDKKILYGNY